MDSIPKLMLPGKLEECTDPDKQKMKELFSGFDERKEEDYKKFFANEIYTKNQIGLNVSTDHSIAVLVEKSQKICKHCVQVEVQIVDRTPILFVLYRTESGATGNVAMDLNSGGLGAASPVPPRHLYLPHFGAGYENLTKEREKAEAALLQARKDCD
jgi:hypothetical protein